MTDRYAILVNTSTEDVGPTVNGLEYGLDLDDGGFEVEVFLDGSATKWADELESNRDHPVGSPFELAEERGLIAGACPHCATTFEATDGIEARGIAYVGEEGEHGPDISELARTHELLTIG